MSVPTFADISGTSSQQIDDVQMMSHMNEDLELRHQCLQLFHVGEICSKIDTYINTLKPEQNGWNFANTISKCIFLKWKLLNYWINWSLHPHRRILTILYGRMIYVTSVQWSLQRGPIFHDITYSTAMTVADHRPNFKLTTDIPYLTLMGELWGIYCKDIRENWSRYDGTALYEFHFFSKIKS